MGGAELHNYSIPIIDIQHENPHQSKLSDKLQHVFELLMATNGKLLVILLLFQCSIYKRSIKKHLDLFYLQSNFNQLFRQLFLNGITLTMGREEFSILESLCDLCKITLGHKRISNLDKVSGLFPFNTILRQIQGCSFF